MKNSVFFAFTNINNNDGNRKRGHDPEKAKRRRIRKANTCLEKHMQVIRVFVYRTNLFMAFCHRMFANRKRVFPKEKEKTTTKLNYWKNYDFCAPVRSKQSIVALDLCRKK